MAPSPHPGLMLRGEVIDGHDRGTVAFGSLADWQRAHGATDTVRFSLAAAAGGAPCRFRDRRGSIWRIELHSPAQASVLADANSVHALGDVGRQRRAA